MLRGTRTRALLIALTLAVALSGCKKPRKVVLTKDQKEQIAAHILTEAPKLEKRIDADLDGRLKLLGVTVSKEKVKPGETFDVTYYWQCVQPVQGDWKVFGHLEHPTPPNQRRQILDHHPVGELYPIEKWQAGQIIEDVQQVRLDSDFPAGTAELWVGVFNDRTWREQGRDDRLRLLNADKVANDGNSRIRAARIQVLGKKGQKGAQRARTYGATKATGPVTVDGKLDEAAWKRARPTQPFVRPDGGKLGARIQTRARMLWDDQNLYIAFSTKDDDVWNERSGRDARLWEQDVVEVYLDPGSDGKDYVELQVAPSGEIFDAWFSSHRRPAWEESAKRFTLAMQAKVVVDGTVNARDDGTTDRGWTVEMAIPFAGLPGLSGPPKEGESWTVNLYRLDSKGAGRMDNQGTWSPAGGDFHNLSGAGRVTFRPALAVRAPAAPGTVATPPVKVSPKTKLTQPVKPAPAPAAPAKPAPAKPAPAKPAPAKPEK